MKTTEKIALQLNQIAGGDKLPECRRLARDLVGKSRDANFLDVYLNTDEMQLEEFAIYDIIVEIDTSDIANEVGLIATTSADYQNNGLDFSNYQNRIYNQGELLSSRHKLSLTNLQRLTTYYIRPYVNINGQTYVYEVTSIFVKPPRYIVLLPTTFEIQTLTETISPETLNANILGLEIIAGNIAQHQEINTDSLKIETSGSSSVPKEATGETTNAINISAGVQ